MNLHNSFIHVLVLCIGFNSIINKFPKALMVFAFK